MQLKFSGGVESPFFQKDVVEEQGTDGVQKIEIDTTRKIRSVSMFVRDNQYLHGLRLEDEEGKTFVDEVWYTSINNKWVTYEIPKG